MKVQSCSFPLEFSLAHSFRSLFGIMIPTCLVPLIALFINMTVAYNITSPTIDLGYAKYRGFHNATLSINTFYGLWFASPPTGPLRWSAPEPIETSQAHPTDIIDATTSGPGCIQGYPY